MKGKPIRINLPLKCLRCGHEWLPRNVEATQKGELPRWCPKCNSYKWNIPKNE